MEGMNNKIIAMVPARAGSTRLKWKNLALLNGKPLISYAIQAALNSGAFDKVIVNSDDPVFGDVAAQYGAEFYLRPRPIGSSLTKSDEVVEDFLRQYPEASAVAWVNPISPLQTPEEISAIVRYFHQGKANSLFTVHEKKAHFLKNMKAINFSLSGKFAQTQDLEPVHEIVYSLMMWQARSFLSAMKEKGYGIMHGKIAYFPVSRKSSLNVKTVEDLRLIEHILISESAPNDQPDIKYHQAVNEIN